MIVPHPLSSTSTPIRTVRIAMTSPQILHLARPVLAYSHTYVPVWLRRSHHGSGFSCPPPPPPPPRLPRRPPRRRLRSPRRRRRRRARADGRSLRCASRRRKTTACWRRQPPARDVMPRAEAPPLGRLAPWRPRRDDGERRGISTPARRQRLVFLVAIGVLIVVFFFIVVVVVVRVARSPFLIAAAAVRLRLALPFGSLCLGTCAFALLDGGGFGRLSSTQGAGGSNTSSSSSSCCFSLLLHGEHWRPPAAARGATTTFLFRRPSCSPTPSSSSLVHRPLWWSAFLHPGAA